MWLWSTDSVEQELFDLYAPALQSLGVNFNDEQLQDTLEASSLGLEDAFRSAIVYMLWLEENLKPIYPTAILIDALANQWRTKYWKPEYLEDVLKVKASQKLCESSDHDPNHCYVDKSLGSFGEPFIQHLRLL